MKFSLKKLAALGVSVIMAMSMSMSAFAANVEITGRIKASELQLLNTRLVEITSARVQIEEIERKFDCL